MMSNMMPTPAAATYRVFLRGEFVSFAPAMTKSEAITQVANKHYSRNEYDLTAIRTKL